MSEWITDRLPTEEDVDINDCVYNELGVYTHWQDIEKGRAWMPIIPPQPYVSVAVSETKHTPGPWIGAGPSFGDPLPRYTTEIVTEWEDEDDQRPVICTLPFRHYDHENEANARLIAAAPELLEALRLLLAECEHQAWIGNMPDDRVEFGIARAAIAKAKGEQP